MRTVVYSTAAALLGAPFVFAQDAVPSPAPAPAPQPNVLIIMASDLGYGDPGIQGGTDIPTPRIDSIGRKGVRLSNAYAAAPVAGPALAGLVTGRYPQRFGFEMEIPAQRNAPQNAGLPLEERTIGDRLKSAGCKTAWIGGWPLGTGTDFHPLSRGFDEFFGWFGEAHSYFPKKRGLKSGGLFRGQTSVDEGAYLTDALGREAADFIGRQQERPFLLCVHFNAVGGPLQAPGDAAKQFPNIENKRRQLYAAMLASLDDNVGRVLDKLAACGLDERTLVIFTSGNGGGARQNASDNAPLRGGRGQVLEGGIRVPLFMRWTGLIPAGKTCDSPVSALDLLPTVMAAAGAEISPDLKLDGASLLPLATGSSASPHARLFWRMGALAAAREGDWKLVREGRGEARLFNLKDDIGERKDLAGEEIGTARNLGTALDEWSSTLAEPLWGVKPEISPAERKPRKAKKKGAAAVPGDKPPEPPITKVRPAQNP